MINKTLVLGIALVTKVIVLFCFPFLVPLLNVTLISAVLPTSINSLGHSGTVHPQLAFTDLINSGALPVFLMMNSVSIDSF